MKLSLARCCLSICTTFALLFGVLGVAPTMASPAVTCIEDQQGADDEPNQKDLTGFCKGLTSDFSLCATPPTGVTFDFGINWNWDDTGLTGTNTGDACALFDTDGDGNANFVLCVTIHLTPAEQFTAAGSPRVYSCGNTRPDRCTSPIVQITSINSTCGVNQVTGSAPPNNVQFTNTSCKGPNCKNQDTQATCCVDLADVGGTSTTVALLLDVCSYPSQQPNSDPSDCIVTQECSTAADCTAEVGQCQTPECGSDGLCRYPIEPGKSCDDGNACTSGDTCNAQGVCVGGTATTCGTPGVCEGAGTCDPTTGGCSFPPLTGTPCDDNNACTTSDTCQAGVCVGGAPLICNDNNVCTDDSCNPATGCVNAPNTAPCDDNNACTVGDRCSGGTCQPGSARNCDDGNVCTDDSCDPTSGCVNTNNNAPCSDNNACTIGDTCSAGTCVPGTPVTCPPPADECHNPGTCNPSTGVCDNPAKGDGSPCSDGNACTGPDTCQSGICQPGPPVFIPG